jgi:hypothetical protein
MFSGLGLGSVMGSPTGTSTNGLGIFPGYAAGHSSNGGQIGLANQNYANQQMGAWAQGAAAQQHLMSIHARQGRELPQWIFDGQPMSFEEFVEAVFPEDCPQKTFFVLKFKK